jgi:hypothetical protein
VSSSHSITRQTVALDLSSAVLNGGLPGWCVRALRPVRSRLIGTSAQLASDPAHRWSVLILRVVLLE